MAKQLIYSEEARAAILRGVDKLANAVRATLGPKGRNVVIDKKYGSPTITKDGVTVAKEIELTDPYENMGAQMLREVASKTSDVAGDGTTTATVLAQAICREGMRNVTAGSNPMAIKRGIDKAVEKVIEALKEISVPTQEYEKIAQVASISANNDKEIGKLIADAMDKVGKDGVITVEENKGMETILDLVEGMEFDKGYLSPYFVTDAEKMSAVFENPYILIHDGKISDMKELLPIMEKVAQSGKSLVIIAEDVTGHALSTLVINKVRGMLSACAVKAPAYGDRRKDMLKDIATLTGGVLISEELGRKLSNAELKDLGQAATVRIEKESTTIIDGAGTKEDIEAKVNEIKTLIENSTSDFDKEKLQERLAKLSGGVAVIKVGAATEVEMKEKKARVEDALHATRAAVEEGIVVGGGVALIRVQSALDNLDGIVGDEKIGLDIVKKSLEYPAKCIATNAGAEGSIIVEKIKIEKGNMGYNAQDDKFEDLVKSGVIDPTKVTRTALQNAASIAGLLITTECLITDIKEEKGDAAAAAAAAMGGGGMY